jgi:hypothetical protein
VAAVVLAALWAGQPAATGEIEPGRLVDPPGAIVAGLTARSYSPGSVAELRVRTPLRHVTLQVLRIGFERHRTRSPNLMRGAPVGSPREVAALGRRLTLPVGHWPSGLYALRLSAPRGRLGFAPFIVRPARLGEHRIAVVLPTNTWAAYNFRDGGSWYLDAKVHEVRLGRPFLNRGVPPHFTSYDLGFLRWLADRKLAVDFLSDDDLERVATGGRLARLYDLVVFSGHEEYVTPHVYDLVTRYRDFGGNLAFLSANNFFYRVTRHGDVLHGRVRWRDIGRPEASLVGAQYVDWNHDRYGNKPYVVVGVQRLPWLFRGTGLHDGSSFGRYGIEIDAPTPRSPPGTMVLARVPDVFGPGKSAEMTYYETPRGAKVFDAGTINFGGTAEFPPVPRLLENLWARLSRP